jgi:hypothetical protein
MFKRPLIWLLALVLLVAGCTQATGQSSPIPADTTSVDTTPDSEAGPTAADGRRATLLSAFYGLDDDLPSMANLRICRDRGNTDGMPVIFSEEIAAETLQAGDFRVQTASGALKPVNCVTLAPALDPGELRTALLVGDLGSADADPPVSVEIVGNLLSLDGDLNFKGATIAVTPLDPGPALTLAESVPATQWKLDQGDGSWSVGNGCPTGTVQAIRAVWQGGITKPGGAEVDDLERAQYTVSLLNAAGVAEEVVPFALGDLDDGDNNHLLCLDREGIPQAVSFPAGYVTDPNEDLNPATRVAVRDSNQ